MVLLTQNKKAMRAVISIKPVLRTDKPINKDGKRPIHFVIYNGQKQFRFSSKLFIEEKYWDRSNSKVQISRNCNDDVRFIHERILQKVEDFKNEIRKHELANEPITEEVIKGHFSGTKTETFYEYYERIVNIRKPTLAKDTIRVYGTTLMILKRYRKSLAFAEVDNDFVRDFDNYLRVTRGNKDGGVTNKHKNLRYIIGQAIDDGLMEKNPYRKFKSTKPNDRLIYLEAEELQRLEEVDVNDFKDGLRLTLDMFLFSCYTGLRYSDVITLKATEVDFKKKMLSKIQVKTRRELQFYLCDKAICILKRNIQEETNMCFARISNAKANKNLKRLMPLAEIDKHLIFHMARHTFGTLLGQASVSIDNISRLMGHASLKETMKYVKPAKELMKKAIATFDSLDSLIPNKRS